MNFTRKNAIFVRPGCLTLSKSVLFFALSFFPSPVLADNADTVARIGAATGIGVEIMRPWQVANVSCVPGDGTIIAIGGHNSKATNKMVANIALQKAAGMVPTLDRNAFDLPAVQLKAAKEKVKILVCVQASSLGAKEKRKDAQEMFAQAGVPAAAVTVADGQVDATLRFDDYHLIYFAGGDQNRLKQMFSAEAIANLHRYLNHGGIISGTSAGAAILSKRMIAGGASPQDGTLSPQVVRTGEGFGFFQCLPIDMHLFQFHRFARSMAALALDPRFADGKPHSGGDDEVILALGQDCAAFIQAVKFEKLASGQISAHQGAEVGAAEKLPPISTTGTDVYLVDNPFTAKPTGAVKVTLFGSTQSWIYQRGPTFQSNLQTLKSPTDLADEWDVKLSVVAPGSWFVIRW